MSIVLEKLKLGNLSESFKEEKISPDIVCKMSLYDFHRLGLHNNTQIMALRMECTKYGSGKPVMNQDEFGHVKYEIPKEVLQSYLMEDFTIAEVATMFSVSESTIYRWMRCYGLSKLNFSGISDDQLDIYVSEIAK